MFMSSSIERDAELFNDPGLSRGSPVLSCSVRAGGVLSLVSSWFERHAFFFIGMFRADGPQRTPCVVAVPPLGPYQ